jgi:hypothetical protein
MTLNEQNYVDISSPSEIRMPRGMYFMIFKGQRCKSRGCGPRTDDAESSAVLLPSQQVKGSTCPIKTNTIYTS